MNTHDLRISQAELRREMAEAERLLARNALACGCPLESQQHETRATFQDEMAATLQDMGNGVRGPVR